MVNGWEQSTLSTWTKPHSMYNITFGYQQKFKIPAEQLAVPQLIKFDRIKPFFNDKEDFS